MGTPGDGPWLLCEQHSPGALQDYRFLLSGIRTHFGLERSRSEYCVAIKRRTNCFRERRARPPFQRRREVRILVSLTDLTHSPQTPLILSIVFLRAFVYFFLSPIPLERNQV